MIDLNAIPRVEEGLDEQRRRTEVEGAMAG